MPNTRHNRRVARRVAKTTIKPTQALIDKYAKSFVLGKKINVNIAPFIALARNAREQLEDDSPVIPS